MIYFLLSKNNKDSNTNIIEFIRSNIQKNNLEYKIIFCNDYLFDVEISNIDEQDYVFWNCNIAGNNIDYVTRYINSIVILEHQTNLNEKIHKLNPFNENLAAVYGIYLMYLNENIEVTKDWKIAINEKDYLITQENVVKNLLSNKNNFKQETINRKDYFDDIVSFTKKQVNL